MDWQNAFEISQHNTQVLGFSPPSEEACRRYFSERVSSKLEESDGAEALKEHLLEMSDTGFDVEALSAQIESSPRAKDWEIGEAFAEVALEDKHEAMFPWPTGYDKRAIKASLPGPDLVGLHRPAAPRFLFGQVKSSSEDRVPPQIIDSSEDCLRNQMKNLLRKRGDRQQLISWLLVRMKGTEWEEGFNEALERYSGGEAWLVGVLVRGGRAANQSDLEPICEGLERLPEDHEVSLLAFYLPFHKDLWVDIIYKKKETP